MGFRTREWLGLRPGYRSSWSSSLLWVTAAYLAIGFAAFAGWRLTGEDDWVEGYFQIPGALLACFLALVELWFSLRVLGNFSSEEPLFSVWLCIAGSSGFDLAGTICSQILGAKTPLNPFAGMSWWPDYRPIFHEYGWLLSGTGRFGLLTLALWLVLGVYRRNRLLSRLQAVDWIACALMAVYVVREVLDMAAASHHRRLTLLEIAGWPVDPLLLLLLGESLLLYRSAQQAGWGLVGRCWSAMSVGAALVCIGVVALWAERWGILPWPWSSLTWYLWLPAGAAFALAPVYQLEAIEQAREARQRDALS